MKAAHHGRWAAPRSSLSAPAHLLGTEILFRRTRALLAAIPLEMGNASAATLPRRAPTVNGETVLLLAP